MNYKTGDYLIVKKFDVTLTSYKLVACLVANKIYVGYKNHDVLGIYTKNINYPGRIRSYDLLNYNLEEKYLGHPCRYIYVQDIIDICTCLHCGVVFLHLEHIKEFKCWDCNL